MAPNIIKFAAIFLLSVLCQRTITASDLNCESLTTADCKKLFGETLDGEFKKLHLETIKTIFQRYLKINDELIKELPSKFDDYIEIVKKSSTKINANLEEIDKNYENNENLAKVITRLPRFEFKSDDNELLPKEVQEIFDRNNWENFIEQALNDLLNKTSQKSMKLYEQLREEDRQDFPIYVKIYEAMKTVSQEAGDFSKKSENFSNAMVMIWENFEAPYLKQYQQMSTI